MPIRTINNIVKYVPTEIQVPVPSASSTLQAYESVNLYLLMQGLTSILEIKEPISEANSNRSRLADAVRAIFHPTEKNMRIQLDYYALYTQNGDNKAEGTAVVKAAVEGAAAVLTQHTHL